MCVEEHGGVVAWSSESCDGGVDLSSCGALCVFAFGEVFEVEAVGVACEFDLSVVVEEVCELDGGFFGEDGSWESFLDADEEFDADVCGVEDSEAEEFSVESGEVLLADFEFSFDGSFECFGFGEFSDEFFVVVEGFELVAVGDFGVGSDEEGFGAEWVVGLCFVVEPAVDGVDGAVGLSVEEESACFCDAGFRGAGLGSGFRLPVAGVVEGVGGGLCVCGGGGERGGEDGGGGACGAGAFVWCGFAHGVYDTGRAGRVWGLDVGVWGLGRGVWFVGLLRKEGRWLVRVAVVYNPMSGRGHASRHAVSLRSDLEGRGHEVVFAETGPSSVRSDLDAAFGEVGAAVIIGGDGTVHHLAPIAARHRTPIYHYPTGTENLFAREFGMRRDAGCVAAAVERLDPNDPAGSALMMDLPRCNRRPFLLLASLGSDANVVRRLAINRSGKINHFSYVPHVVGELMARATPRMTIVADGQTVAEHEQGWAVVANARQYALRVDPAPLASPSDGMLDVVFCPASNSVSLLGWMIRARLRNHTWSPRVRTVRARHVAITTERPAHYQLDGEAPLDSSGDDRLGPSTTPIEVTVEHAVLPVMVPVVGAVGVGVGAERGRPMVGVGAAAVVE